MVKLFLPAVAALGLIFTSCVSTLQPAGPQDLVSGVLHLPALPTESPLILKGSRYLIPQEISGQTWYWLFDSGAQVSGFLPAARKVINLRSTGKGLWVHLPFMAAQRLEPLVAFDQVPLAGGILKAGIWPLALDAGEIAWTGDPVYDSKIIGLIGPPAFKNLRVEFHPDRKVIQIKGSGAQPEDLVSYPLLGAQESLYHTQTQVQWKGQTVNLLFDTGQPKTIMGKDMVLRLFREARDKEGLWKSVQESVSVYRMGGETLLWPGADILVSSPPGSSVHGLVIGWNTLSRYKFFIDGTAMRFGLMGKPVQESEVQEPVFGITLVQEDQHLRVQSVLVRNGQSLVPQLAPGDLIKKINGKETSRKSKLDWERVWEESEELLLLLDHREPDNLVRLKKIPLFETFPQVM